MMAGQIILNDLNSGKLDNVGQMTLDYLGPIINSPDEKEEGSYNRYGMFAAKFLHGSVVHISAGRQPESLLEAVLACCQCYQRTKGSVNLTEPITVLKLLYHVVSKTQYKENFEFVLEIAQYLYHELLNLSTEKLEGTVLSILSGSYSHLWNICIKLEDDKNFSCYAHTLRFRHLALKILLLRKDSLSQVVDKFLLAVNRFDSLIQQLSSRDSGKVNEEAVLLPMHLSNEMLQLMVSHILTSGNDKSSNLILPVLLYLLKFTQKNNNLDQIELILSHIHEICTGCSMHDALVQLFTIFQTVFKTLQSKQKVKCYCKEILKDFDLMNTFCGKYFEHLENDIQVLYINLYLNQLRQIEKIIKETGCDLLTGNDVIEVTNGAAGAIKAVQTVFLKQKQGLELILDLLNLEITITYKTMKLVKDEALQASLLDSAVAAQQIYISLLDGDNTGISAKILEQKRYACGYLMSNLGTLCDDRGLYQAAILFYQASYEQMSKWAMMNPELKQERMEEVKLQRLLDCYIEMHIKASNLEEAMKVIADSLLENLSHVTTAVKSWTRVKKEALRKGDKTLPTKTLGSTVKEAMKSSKNLNLVHLLSEELNIFKNSRKRYYDVEYGLLYDLLEKSVTCTPVERARFELDMVHLLWLSGLDTERPIQDYLKDAELHVCSCTDIEGQAMLGEVYIWQYIILQGEWCDQALSATLKMSEISRHQDVAPRGEESEITSTDSSEDIFTFGMETSAMRKLENAFSIWEKITNGEIDNRIDVNSLVKSLLLAASICRLTGKQSFELQALQMASKLAKNKGSGVQSSSILGRVVDVLVNSGMNTEADKFLSDIQRSSGSKDSKFEEENVLNVLRLSELQLHTGQIQKATDTLQNVFDFISSQKSKGRFVCTVEGRAKRLMSVILGMPGDHVTGTETVEYSLDLAHEAQRMHTGVYHFLLGKDVLKNVETKGHDFEMFDVIHQVLTTLLHYGRLYRLIGELRDAKCYLKEGWKIAHHFGIPYWTGQFLIEITRISVMAESMDEAVKAILDCHRLLGSKITFENSAEEVGLKALKQDKGKSRNVRESSDSAFGFEDLQIEDEKHHLDSKETNVTNMSLEVTVPPCFRHVTDNKPCDFCCDTHSQLFTMQLGYAVSQYCSVFSSESAAVESLEDIQNYLVKVVGPKSEKIEKRSKCDKNKKTVETCEIPSKLTINTCPEFKSLYLEALVQKAELHCSEGEKVLCSEILKLVTQFVESGELAGVFHSCFFTARLELCSALMMLPENVVENSEMDIERNLEVSTKNLNKKMDADNDVELLSKDLNKLKLEGEKSTISCLEDTISKQVPVPTSSAEPTLDIVKTNEVKTGKSAPRSKLKQLNSTISNSKTGVKSDAQERVVKDNKPEESVKVPVRRGAKKSANIKNDLTIPSSRQSRTTVNKYKEKVTNMEKENSGDIDHQKIANEDQILQQKNQEICSTPKAKDSNNLKKEPDFNFCTPSISKSTLPLKTPRSVCSSRKVALDMLIDSSDEEEPVKRSNRGGARGRGRGRKANSKDIAAPKKALYQNNFDSNSKLVEDETVCKSKEKVSRIPRLISETKLATKEETSKDLENQKSKGKQLDKNNKIKEVKKRGRGNSSKITAEIECQRNADTELDKEELCEVNDIDVCTSPNIESKRSGGGLKNKTLCVQKNKKENRFNGEIINDRENEDVREKSNGMNIYEFDEIDTPNTREKNIQSKTRAKGNKTANVTRGGKSKRIAKSVNKCDKIERARTMFDSVDSLLSETSYCDVSSDICEPVNMSSDSEPESCGENDECTGGLLQANSDFILKEDLDCPSIFLEPEPEEEIHIEDNIDLDDSIEIMRGDDKKTKLTARQTTQTRKKSGKTSTSETTEVLRSSRPTKSNYLDSSNITKPSSKRPIETAAIQTEPVTETSDANVIQTLERAFNQIKHFPPCQTYTTICQMLALQHLHISPSKAAYYLNESVAVTFRHQAMVNTGKKIGKSLRQNETQNKSKDSPEDGSGSPATNDVKAMDRMRMAKSCLMFNKTVDDLKIMTDAIPDGWAVCQISVVTNHHKMPQMLLTRYQKDEEPIIVRIPGFTSLRGKEILPEFDSIVEASSNSFKIKDKAEWWKLRIQLDDRMHSLLLDIEKYWLQHWKILLSGNLNLKKLDVTKLKAECKWLCGELEKYLGKKISHHLALVMLQSCDSLTDQEVESALCELTDRKISQSDVSQLIPVLRSKMEGFDKSRQHVLLILDKNIQHLPWENIPVLRQCSLSRIPSLYHMYIQLSYLQTEENSVYRQGVDSRNVFYVINPENDFASTQETFQSWFESEEGWQGIITGEPTSKQISQALTERDLFLYCGHGSGSKYLPGVDLQQLTCRSVAILMGCSSGRLLTKGHLDAAGMMLNYFLADCPCVVSNLWDITDKDIDRFLESLLKKWLPSKQGTSLLDVIPEARETCRLRYLTGAAPVVYGFPVSLKK